MTKRKLKPGDWVIKHNEHGGRTVTIHEESLKWSGEQGYILNYSGVIGVSTWFESELIFLRGGQLILE